MKKILAIILVSLFTYPSFGQHLDIKPQIYNVRPDNQDTVLNVIFKVYGIDGFYENQTVNVKVDILPFTAEKVTDYTKPNNSKFTLSSTRDRDTFAIRIYRNNTDQKKTFLLQFTYTDFNGVIIQMKEEIKINILPADSKVGSNLGNKWFNAYLGAIKNFDSTYNCGTSKGDPKASRSDIPPINAVASQVLDSNLRIIYSSVALGSADVVQTGTQVAITQDNTGGSLSFNNSLLGKRGRQAFNFGVNAKTSDAIYNIYSPSSWSSEIGLNMGITKVLGRSKQNFDGGDCFLLRARREKYWTQLLALYRSVIHQDPAELERKKDEIDAKLDFNSSGKINLTVAQVNSLLASSDSLEAQIGLYKRLVDLNMDPTKEDKKLNDFLKRNIIADVDTFDRSNDILTGYEFTWFDFKAGISNNSIKPALDSTLKDSTNQFSTKNLPKIFFQPSINWTHLSNNNPNRAGILLFAQLSMLIMRGSYLDQPGLSGAPKVNNTASYTVTDSATGRTLGNYNEFTKSVWYFTPSLYAAAFFFKGQQMGFDFRASFCSALANSSTTSIDNTFTILLGPVFRVAGETDFSKATIGIKAGLINASVNSNRIWKDNFGVRLELGVPFKWHYKEIEKS